MANSFAPACLLILAASALNAQAMPAATLKWGPAPAAFPPGATMAVVSGDPSAAGLFTIQLSMPDGYRIPPHFHPTDEAVEVKDGTFLFGMGDAFDSSKLQAMTPGQKGSVPANAHHFAQAKGATVVAVTAMGPFAMTYVNPADDPRKRAKP
jgi:quercetin dioxygenase-like cupin family protein